MNLREAKIKYDAWQIPNRKSLKHEYDIEYGHHIKYDYGEIWPTFNDFLKSVKNAKQKTISSTSGIDGMTRHRDFEGLMSMIKSYRSYPQYRNEKTVKALYDRYKDNKPMDMPLVLKTKSGLRIMAGNTRSDIAFQLGIKPRVLVIDISELEE